MPIHLATNCTELLELQYKCKCHRLHAVMQTRLQSYTNKNGNSIGSCSQFAVISSASFPYGKVVWTCRQIWIGCRMLNAAFQGRISIDNSFKLFKKVILCRVRTFQVYFIKQCPKLKQLVKFTHPGWGIRDVQVAQDSFKPVSTHCLDKARGTSGKE